MSKATKTHVRGAYTFETVRASLKAQHDAIDARGRKTSYRKIAVLYGVSHAVIHRAAVYGIEPKDNAIRHALGLPPHAVTVAPLGCGHAPIAKRCPICQPRSTTPNATRKRSKRLEAMRAGLQLARTLDSMTG